MKQVDTLPRAFGSALASLAGNIHLHEAQQLMLKAPFGAAAQQLAAVSLQNTAGHGRGLANAGQTCLFVGYICYSLSRWKSTFSGRTREIASHYSFQWRQRQQLRPSHSLSSASGPPGCCTLSASSSWSLVADPWIPDPLRRVCRKGCDGGAPSCC